MKSVLRKRGNLKFPEMLGKLIDRDKRSVARKEICRRIGISQAVLSQYLLGKSTPRLPTLVALADFFGVDLHYLVLGEQLQPPRTIDLGPFEYIDKSLAGLHAKNDAYFSAVARMTSALAQEIETAARKVIDEYNISGGVIHDNEIFTIEQFSEETVLVRLRLDYEFDVKEGQPYRTTPGGRFLPLVAKNVCEGRKYTYILPRAVCDWRAPVREFRKALSALGVRDDDLREHCRVGTTGAPLVAGCVLYRINFDRFQAGCPHLHARLAGAVLRDRREAWLGCTLPPSTKLQANPVMDNYHLNQARKMVSYILENDWKQM